MKYVFRLSSQTLEKLDLVAPPRAHQRSKFIREAIAEYLLKQKQHLADRPHLRGRADGYKQVCALLTQDQIDAITSIYPDVSLSVVIQAAITVKLKKVMRNRMKSFLATDGGQINVTEKNADADENTNTFARNDEIVSS
jgi:metal-responsive CopG/Arc/MetJ family transcriptional regulator